mmetsp:Transcript_19703/g.57234  ORF Transcript_19703/g.57234 Transcript_19703/m.57234 type:complete len:221 (-) Transcript_19703:637-1299(-)
MKHHAINRAVLAAAAIASLLTNEVTAFSGSLLARGADVTKLKLPPGFDIEAAGGWSEIERLAADPKSELVSLIVSGLKGSGGNVDVLSSEKLEMLESLLLNCGKGFGADLVDGEWVSVLSRQGKKSPRFQKLVNKRDKVQNSFANFDISTQTFLNLAYTPHQRGQLKALVEYNPVPDNHDLSADGKVVLRRIACDITDVNFKYWKLPKLTLPLKKERRIS